MAFIKTALLSIAIGAGASALSASVLSASACDLTDLPCWDGGKCNIKFKNHTAKSSGSGNSDVSQSSLAQTIRVTAKDSKGKKTGNAFSINAGASKTMNLEKKKDLSFVRIKTETSGVSIDSLDMKCSALRDVLRGNGNCNILYGYDTTVQWTLAYSCDNKTVNGPQF
ncbi:MAG: hypothetical protein AAFY82_04570 [Pseudomonadota bacterium]